MRVSRLYLYVHVCIHTICVRPSIPPAHRTNTPNHTKTKPGGYIQQIKQPVVHAFKPLAACLASPPQQQEFVLADFAKMERPPLLLLAFRCVLQVYMCMCEMSGAQQQKAPHAGKDESNPSHPNRISTQTRTPSSALHQFAEQNGGALPRPGKKR